MPAYRTFVAIPTSSDIKQKILGIQDQLIQSHVNVTWEPAEKFHITLKFLGNCELELLGSLTTELQSVLRDVRSFDVVYRNVGCFPTISRPRVVWIGAAENVELAELQQRVEETCGNFGFPKEDRAFHPHITLGRVKGTRNLDRLTDRVKTITFDSIQARCGEVHIMRSELLPTGSVYTLIHSIPLL
ncbi:MAG: RNA 2',3'-cyclic phosphodiesterase [Ignavibacteria bacterium]|nr:RNA 2',3'-cyclic phosphodiesterase [Ignavibacteria bacterium]